MKDKLSALLDGDLDEHSVHPVLDSMRRDRSLRADWETYCMIGDVLRGDREPPPNLVASVMEGIEREPTVLAPPSAVAGTGRSGLWRSLMPLAASVMGVAAVGWVAHTLYSQPEAVVKLAATPVRAQVAEAAAQPARSPVPAGVQEDPHREYVFAHQAMTGGGPIPGPVQYVRTVSEVRQDGAR